MPAKPDLPSPQYLSAEHVLGAMCDFGSRRIEQLSALQILVLGVVAGGFITAGALFSVLLAQGVDTPGVTRLLEGLGFSTGFFFVVLSEAVLFTEANVVLPAVLLHRSRKERLALWWNVVPAGIGNVIGGAFLVALPFWYALRPEEREDVVRGRRQTTPSP